MAENGAVWLPFDEGAQHAQAFLTQHLGLYIRREDIVPTMVEAYQRIQDQALPSFGVFISGPSKTADIEQCLVIGAHGPKSLTLFVIP